MLDRIISSIPVLPVACALSLLVVSLDVTAEELDLSDLRTILQEKIGTPNPDDIEYPDFDPPTEAEVSLGKQLFYDRRLSQHKNISCASCHNPEVGTGDGLALSRGTTGNTVPRNSPHIYNLAFNQVFFWDGRASSLEEQALGPVQAAGEMNMPLPDMLARLQEVPGYVEQFNKVYPDGLTTDNVGKAIASFERTIISNDSPFDRFLAGDDHAMSHEAKLGAQLFVGKAECIQCHSGPNLTDQSFQDLGLASLDRGRADVVNVETLAHAFKTPGLRNTALTAPYMHDGSLGSLEDVVEFYNRGGDRETKNPLVKKLNLTKPEVMNLVAFMYALTDPVEVKPPVLPGDAITKKD